MAGQVLLFLPCSASALAHPSVGGYGQCAGVMGVQGGVRVPHRLLRLFSMLSRIAGRLSWLSGFACACIQGR